MNEVIPYNAPNQSFFETQEDFSIVQKLLRKSSYQIPEHLRDQAIRKIQDLLTTSERESTVINAIRTMLKMDEINLKQVQLAMPKKTITRDVKTLSDEELQLAIQEVAKFLPLKNVQQLTAGA